MFDKIKKMVPGYLKEGAQIIDVRTPEEFNAGHAEDSINIPLQIFASQISQLDKNKTILLCCRSGNRSGMALQLLQSQGFKNVHNVGPWTNCLV